MASRKQREEARRLWLSGELTEPEIAKRLRVTAKSIERWKRDEGWEDLREIIDARAALKHAEGEAAADERSLKMADVLENLVIRMMQKGVTGLKAADVKALGTTMKMAMDVRRAVRRNRRIRDIEQGRKG